MFSTDSEGESDVEHVHIGKDGPEHGHRKKRGRFENDHKRSKKRRKLDKNNLSLNSERLRKLINRILKKKPNLTFEEFNAAFKKEFGFGFDPQDFGKYTAKDVFAEIHTVEVAHNPFKNTTTLKRRNVDPNGYGERFTGRVLRWNDARGFGYVKPHNVKAVGASEVFAHHSEIQTIGFRRLVVNQMVEFSRGSTRAGHLCGVRITAVGGGLLHDRDDLIKSTEGEPDISNGFSKLRGSSTNAYENNTELGPEWLVNIMAEDNAKKAAGVKTLYKLFTEEESGAVFDYQSELARVLLLEREDIIALLVNLSCRGHFGVRATSMRVITVLLESPPHKDIIMKTDITQKLCAVVATAPTPEIFHQSITVLGKVAKENIMDITECLQRGVLRPVLLKCKPNIHISVLRSMTNLISIVTECQGQVSAARPVKDLMELLRELIFTADRICLQHVLLTLHHLTEDQRTAEHEAACSLVDSRTCLQLLNILLSDWSWDRKEIIILGIIENCLHNGPTIAIFSFMKKLATQNKISRRRLAHDMIEQTISNVEGNVLTRLIQTIIESNYFLVLQGLSILDPEKSTADRAKQVIYIILEQMSSSQRRSIQKLEIPIKSLPNEEEQRRQDLEIHQEEENRMDADDDDDDKELSDIREVQDARVGDKIQTPRGVGTVVRASQNGDFQVALMEDKGTVVTLPKEILQNFTVACTSTVSEHDRVETSFGIGRVVEVGDDGIFVVKFEFGTAFLQASQVKKIEDEVLSEGEMLFAQLRRVFPRAQRSSYFSSRKGWDVDSLEMDLEREMDELQNIFETLKSLNPMVQRDRYFLDDYGWDVNRLKGDLSLAKNTRIRQVGLYNSEQEILVVGDGDFSFSCALVKGLVKCDHDGNVLEKAPIIATAFESSLGLLQKFEDVVLQVHTLQRLGMAVHFEVDATSFKEELFSDVTLFDRVIFNFPDADEEAHDIRGNRRLVERFFLQCQPRLKHTGQVHVTLEIERNDGDSKLKETQFTKWHIEQQSQKSQMQLVSKHRFAFSEYPGYRCQAKRKKRGSIEAYTYAFDIVDDEEFIDTYGSIEKYPPD